MRRCNDEEKIISMLLQFYVFTLQNIFIQKGLFMKIAILTNFQEFQPGYSLTGIVLDQATMLTKYGHEVHLFVNSKYNGDEFSSDVILEKKIPFSHLIDYKSMKDLTDEHQNIRDKTAAILQEELSKDYEVAFTHDFVFTGWFLPYGLGCMLAGKQLPHVRWMHWVHSVPTAMSDWWNIRMYGTKHKLIYPNKTDALRLAEAFNGKLIDVRVIPHIKDMRSFCDFDSETIEFIDQHPEIMQNDVVQVYPASVDRLSAKRVREVMMLLGFIKKRGFSVCLVIANQWATGRQQREDVEKYKKIASRQGLADGTELVFTSDYKEGKFGVGIPKRMLRELMMCSNLFIFPTREESFGLVVPEAALASGCFMVLNKSLTMQLEITGHTGLYFDFGSYHTQHAVDNEEVHYSNVANVILGRMQQNEAVQTKTFVRQRYNWDHLYNKYYAPVLAESQIWV